MIILHFTISFFDKDYERDLAIIGSKSGRDGDKFALTKITPQAYKDMVVFKEASLTLVCRKIYWEQFDEKHMDPEIVQSLYKDLNQPTHYQFIGEIVEVLKPEQ